MNPIEKFKHTCRRYLVLQEGHEYIDVVFGTIFANRLDSASLWLYLIGAPSSGKTEILRAIQEHPSVVCCDTLTPAALISTREAGGKKIIESPLLPKLDNKMLIIKDFTAMLGMKYEDLITVLGYLRTIYDGGIKKEFARESIEHKAKFGIIAAVTNAIDRHLSVLADLGERFLSYRIPKITKEEEKKRCMMATGIESLEEQEAILREAAHKVLDMRPSSPIITKRQRSELSNAAMITARARTQVKRDRYTKDPEEIQGEVAVRLSKQLANLARGIAMARAKKAVTAEEVALASRVALYTLPLRRIRLLSMLCEQEWMDTTELTRRLHLSDAGARIQLDDLELVGLCDQDSGVRDGGGVRTLWRLRERAKVARMLRGVEIPE